MSHFDLASVPLSELASELSARCRDATDRDHLEEIANEKVGQVFASVLRVFAAKEPNGEPVRPFSRNKGVSATNVAIGCTAMLESVNLAPFELGAWQSMSGIGRLSHQE